MEVIGHPIIYRSQLYIVQRNRLNIHNAIVNSMQARLVDFEDGVTKRNAWMNMLSVELNGIKTNSNEIKHLFYYQ